MRVKKGMMGKYLTWRKKMTEHPRGKLIFRIVEAISKKLDTGIVGGHEILNEFLRYRSGGLSLEDRTMVALAVSVFHPRGKEVRIYWNCHYQGMDWALEMEASGKERIFNPC